MTSHHNQEKSRFQKSFDLLAMKELSDARTELFRLRQEMGEANDRIGRLEVKFNDLAASRA